MVKQPQSSSDVRWGRAHLRASVCPPGRKTGFQLHLGAVTDAAMGQFHHSWDCAACPVAVGGISLGKGGSCLSSIRSI